jgi:hypothetical protein
VYIEIAAPKAEVEDALVRFVGADWQSKIKLGERRVERQEVRSLGEIPWPEVVATVEVLAGYAAGGVVGNAAYAGVKELVAQLRRHFGKANVSDTRERTASTDRDANGGAAGRDIT